MNNFIFYLLFVSFCGCSYTKVLAQQESLRLALPTDSLWEELSLQKGENILFKVADIMDERSFAEDTLELKNLIQKIKRKGEKRKEWKAAYYYADAFYRSSLNHYADDELYKSSADKYYSAVESYQKSIELLKILGYDRSVLNSKRKLAAALLKINRVEDAIQIYDELDAYYKKNSLTKHDTATWLSVNNKVAYLHYNNKEYAIALVRLQKILDLSESARDSVNLQRTLYLMEGVQKLIGEKEAARETGKKLIALHEASPPTIFHQYGALEVKLAYASSQELAYSHFKSMDSLYHLSKLNNPFIHYFGYAEWLKSNVSIEAAFPYYKDILGMITECAHGYPEVQVAIFQYYMKQNRPRQVIREAKILLECEKIYDNYELLNSLYSMISEAYANTSQMDSAYAYLNKTLVARDSIVSSKKLEKTIRVFMQNQFEQEKQLIELEQAQERNLNLARIQLQRFILFGVGLILILISILSFILYRSYRKEKKHVIQLDNYNQRLELSNARLDRFASGISHDILSKLNLILSTGHLKSISDKEIDFLQWFYERSMKITAQVRDYSVSLLSTAQFIPTEGEVGILNDPNEIVRKVLRENIDTLKEQKIEIHTAPLPKISLEKVEFIQILQNLLLNSIDALQNTNAPLIQIYSKNNGQEFEIIFADNGPGVPPENLEKIFEKGVSSKKNGHGLGLSLVKDLVVQANGKVWGQESTLGGLAIHLSFPIS